MPDFDPSEIEKHEKSAWESTAEIYADTGGAISALAGQAELIVDFGQIDGTCRVLELGCGPGQLTDALSKVARTVEGVDFAENMIDAARKAFPDLVFKLPTGKNCHSRTRCLMSWRSTTQRTILRDRSASSQRFCVR